MLCDECGCPLPRLERWLVNDETGEHRAVCHVCYDLMEAIACNPYFLELQIDFYREQDRRWHILHDQ